MSRRQFITLRTQNSNEEVDLELPGSQPLEALMPDILKVLNWPQQNGSHALVYALQTETGIKIDPKQSMVDAGVENFDVLWISLEGEAAVAEGVQPAAGDAGGHTVGEIGEGQLPAPLWVSLPIDQPCLVSDEGLIFMLSKSTMIVGRRSREGNPNIDLTELDRPLISSRRHAEIVYTNQRYELRAFKTRNGTLLNGTIIQPGEPHVLKDGDVLHFGFRGVKLVFRQP